MSDKVVFDFIDLVAATLSEFLTKTQPMVKEGILARSFASWSNDVALLGGSQVTAIVYDKQSKELTRIAPRLVITSMRQWYRFASGFEIRLPNNATGTKSQAEPGLCNCRVDRKNRAVAPS